MKLMVEHLIQCSDESWGNYAIQCDPLNRKIGQSVRSEIIAKSNECGRAYALHMKERFGKLSVQEYAKMLGIRLIVDSGADCPNYIMFARFDHPDIITIYRQNLEAVCRLIHDAGISQLLENADPSCMALAHEIFHFIESKDRTIYTKNKSICLWKLGILQYKSALLAPSEIAAMSFARELLALNFNPYILNFFILWLYNRQQAVKLYHEIMGYEKEAWSKRIMQESFTLNASIDAQSGPEEF